MPFFTNSSSWTSQRLCVGGGSVSTRTSKFEQNIWAHGRTCFGREGNSGCTVKTNAFLGSVHLYFRIIDCGDSYTFFIRVVKLLLCRQGRSFKALLWMSVLLHVDGGNSSGSFEKIYLTHFFFARIYKSAYGWDCGALGFVEGKLSSWQSVPERKRVQIP